MLCINILYIWVLVFLTKKNIVKITDQIMRIILTL